MFLQPQKCKTKCEVCNLRVGKTTFSEKLQNDPKCKETKCGKNALPYLAPLAQPVVGVWTQNGSFLRPNVDSATPAFFQEPFCPALLFFFEQQSILLLSCIPDDENWQCCCCCSGILESDMCPLHCTEILRMSYISLIFSFVDRTGSINNFQSCTVFQRF